MIIGDITTKTAFANVVRSTATTLASTLDFLAELQAAYITRGYQSGGADPIADADVAGAKITASDLNQLLNSAWLVSRLTALMNEQVVSGTIAGNAIINRLRADM